MDQMTGRMLGLAAAFAACVSAFGGEPWMEKGKPAEERARLLTAAMTLEEKADELLIHYVNEPELYDYFTNRLAHGRTFGAIMKVTGAWQARELQELALRTHRLKVPFIYHEDVTHGFRTVLPVGLGTACTWDEDLVERCEAMAAREAVSSGFHLTYAPMCDISDDPRWGRICETSGESPYLSARITAARVRGFRRHFASCIKHYAAYGSLRTGRDYHPADCSVRDLEETYLAPYRAAIAEGVDAVMCAYTPFDAEDCTFSEFLNKRVLRDELGFTGELMTDWQTIRSGLRYGIAKDERECALRAIRGGIDADMRSDIYGDWLPRLVREGAVEERLVDEACARCLTLKFRLGLFDDPFARGCDEAAEKAAQFTDENRALARAAVREGAVLLENRGGVLPLPTGAKVAVTGPLADAPKDQLGDWPCFGRTNETVTLRTGFREAWGRNLVGVDEAGTVVYCAGERVAWGGEHHSRLNPCVPREQVAEMKALKAKGKRVVAIVLACRPLILADVREAADAVIFSFFPGTEGGHGLADLVAGAANPSGRLVQTFPRELGQIPLSHRERRPWAYDEWVDGSTKPLYPFGYGLSYTTFAYARPVVKDGEVSVEVANTGSREGVETVQLYVRKELSRLVERERELKGFRRVTLKPGERKTVAFRLDAEMFKSFTVDHDWRDEPCTAMLYVGPDAATTNGVRHVHPGEVRKGQSWWTKAKYPKVTSPERICVRPGERFEYRVAYESKAPLAVTVCGFARAPMPEGLAFDPGSGVVSGTLAKEGKTGITVILEDPATGATVAWGDVAIKVEGAKESPKSLGGEVIYQIQLRSFTPEGTLKAAAKHLPRLKELGVDWVYLCPVMTADRDADRTFWSDRQKRSGCDSAKNPYRISDYDHVDPDYGTDEDLRDFVREAHRLGMKSMLDIVFLHCGPKAVFLKEHPDFVCRNEKGEFVNAEWRFPKLNFASRGLRDYLKGNLLRWIREFDVDGFRCDVGDQVPLDFWEECRPALDAAKRDFVMVLEGTRPAYGRKAFDVFYGFLASNDGLCQAMDERKPASYFRQRWEDERAQGPAGIRYLRYTDNHDVTNDDYDRRQELRWGHKRSEAALALCFAIDGVTMLAMGQEIGWDRRISIFGPMPIDWMRTPDPSRPAVIRRLAALRKRPAFREGAVRWLVSKDPDSELDFERIAPDGETWRCHFNLITGEWSVEPACRTEMIAPGR